MKYTVYILKCADSTYYTGVTTNLARRLAEYNKGTAAKYTHPPCRRPVEMVYQETAADRSAAQQREYAIKQLSRKEKEDLIKKEAVKKTFVFLQPLLFNLGGRMRCNASSPVLRRGSASIRLP